MDYELGYNITYSFKKVIFSGKIVKHIQIITKEFYEEKIHSKIENKFYILLDKLHLISIIEDNNEEITILKVNKN